MAYILQDVLDRARFPLNDDDADRYPDARLMPVVKGAFETAFRKRPDLFFALLTDVPPLDFSAMVVGEPFPLPDEYLQVIADYVTARAEGVDDEHMSTGRARNYYELFLMG